MYRNPEGLVVYSASSDYQNCYCCQYACKDNDVGKVVKVYAGVDALICFIIHKGNRFFFSCRSKL
ncbi:MAG TPA: hypothetical protein IAD39_08985, partial [Candidatus Merdisoma faecalis]|nr:hypothetical protein [Candidatus Merdisoma faecalis]